ncbi:MAG: PAS domain-containing protein, partial [Rhodoferax sp.]|nr:PAS domain-containing protein [Rhodoferax sp.]
MNLCSGALMLSHLAWSSPLTLLHVAGLLTAPLLSSAHMFLSLRAIQQLQGEKPGATASGKVFAALLLVHGGVLFAFNSLEVYGGVSGSVWLLIGAIAIGRLWHMGWSEKFIALLLLCLGLNTLVLVVLGDAWTPYLYANSCVLRVALATAVMYCALARTFNKAAVARARFEHLSEKARHGIVVCSEQRLLYANPAALKIFGFGSLEQVQTIDLFSSKPQHYCG